MQDRELLELAAKADGLIVRKNTEMVDSEDRFIGLRVREDVKSPYRTWNPLTDDGDALRLAIDLGMDLQLEGEMNHPHAVSVCEMKSGAFAREALSSDKRASTRRAIVRTAAGIGRDMP